MREERRMAQNSTSHLLNYVHLSPSFEKHLTGSTFPLVHVCTPPRWFNFDRFVCWRWIMEGSASNLIQVTKLLPHCRHSSLSLISSSVHNISSSGVGEWPHIGLSSGPVISPWLTSARSWREKLKRHHWMMWHRMKKILTAKPTFLIRFSSVSFLFSPSVIRSTPSPPRWKSNKSADIDPVVPAGPILFQPKRDGYLQKSWQTIVFTIFFLRANKGGAVIASDYMKNHLMIPIYNSRLNNDTVKSWQAVINEGSYKTYLVWRLAGDELHSDTNSW